MTTRAGGLGMTLPCFPRFTSKKEKREEIARTLQLVPINHSFSWWQQELEGWVWLSPSVHALLPSCFFFIVVYYFFYSFLCIALHSFLFIALLPLFPSSGIDLTAADTVILFDSDWNPLFCFYMLVSFPVSEFCCFSSRHQFDCSWHRDHVSQWPTLNDCSVMTCLFCFLSCLWFLIFLRVIFVLCRYQLDCSWHRDFVW